MSLVGNLADLGLGDIFQIVSLSRRSGSLRLDTPVESGEIVFVSGKVVAASRTQPPHTAGDVLLEHNVVSPMQYQEMLAEQGRGTTGAALFAKFTLDAELLDKAMEALLTRNVYHMFEWDEGSFSFVLALDPPLWTGFSLTGGRAVLTRGLNPQYLAIEGARVRDERTRQDPLESFLARGKAPRESSSQATAELSSALRSPDLDLQLAADEAASPEPALPAPSAPEASAPGPAPEPAPADENIIPFPQARRKQAETIVPPPVVPPPARVVSTGPALTAPGAALRPTAAVPPVGLVIPPDSIFATSTAARAIAVHRHLLVVDDDPMTARLIASELGEGFAVTHTASKVAEAVELLGKLAGETIVVAVDLIVPRSDGRGILGGIEVLEKVRETVAEAPVVAFSDYPNEEAETRAKALGVTSILAKPRKLQVFADDGGRAPSDAMRTFLRSLREALDDTSNKGQSPTPSGYRFGAPPKPPPVPPPIQQAAPPAGLEGPSPPFTVDELDSAVDVGHLVDAAQRDLGSPRTGGQAELSSLRWMLAELIDPANRDTITLLVLRYASEVIERGGLFLVTRRAFVGLGGFLLNAESESFVARVRRIQIPVDQDSVFARVTQYRSTIRSSLADTPANRAILEGLGGTWHSAQTLVIPIISGDRVAAILFGDNPSGKPLGATESLEIFLQQAGLAMDRALLERRLEESKKKRDS